MPALTLKLLGPPRVELDGEPVRFELRKALALLAYLAITHRPHARDALATLLWPELGQSSARARLRRALADLRKGVSEGWIEADRETIGLNAAPGIWVDVDRFRLLARRSCGQDHPPADVCGACSASLEEAADLYEGDFLAGFTLRNSPGFDEWQYFEAEGLRDDLSGVLERLTVWYGSQRAHDASIGCARRWVALDPLHEPAHRALMTAYGHAGQRSAAMRQYQECARVLETELGLAPSPETQELSERIRVGDLGSGAAPAASVQPPHRSLPSQPIPLVGREQELEDITRRISDPACRLLTLVGLGGSGKTRLAVEAAALMLDDFEHGVFFVSLDGRESVDGIILTAIKALGLSLLDQHDPEEQLLTYLSHRQMLLVLDSFEHLIVRDDRQERDGTGLVAAILQAAPGVKLLVTSRAALRVQGEHLYDVGGLSYPDLRAATEDSPADGCSPRYGAIDLFVQSAQRGAAGFSLSPHNAVDVAHICRLVSGMPLGILLAAAWVRLLTPAEIVSHLNEGLDLLDTDLRDVPVRQRSMRVVFDHSWRLLTTREREVTAALAVFLGGFTRQAARAVVGASLRDLRSLADLSLVHHVAGGRYQIHEMLRQYLAERLEASDDERSVRDRHCAYFTAALVAWGKSLEGARQGDALLEVDRDLDNAMAAWNWAVEQGDVGSIGKASDCLHGYYVRRSRSDEGEAALRRAKEALPASARLAAGSAEDLLSVLLKIRGYQASLALNAGHSQAARAVVDEGLAMAEDAGVGSPDLTSAQAYLWWVRGQLGRVTGRGDAEDAIARSIALFRTAGNRAGVAQSLCAMGRVKFVAGRYQEAEQHLEESASIYRQLAHPLGLAESLFVLGMAHSCEGRAEDSEVVAREGLAIRRQLGYPTAVADGLSGLAWAHAWAGRWAESIPLVEERVSLYRDLGLTDAYGLQSLGWYALNLGLYARARKQLAAALDAAAEMDQAFMVAAAQAALGQIALVEGMTDRASRLIKESLVRYEATGYWDWAERARCYLAYTFHEPEECGRARAQLRRGVAWAADHGSLPVLVEVLPASAFVLLGCGEVERAVDLYELARTLPPVAHSRWVEDVVGKPITLAASTLPPAVLAAAKERGQARDVSATLRELLADWPR